MISVDRRSLDSREWISTRLTCHDRKQMSRSVLSSSCICLLTFFVIASEASAQSEGPWWPRRYGGEDHSASFSAQEQTVFSEFVHVLSVGGRRPCRSSARLTAAARQHARQLLSARTSNRLTLDAVRLEVLRAGAVDPVIIPWSLAYMGELELGAYGERLNERFSTRPPTHCGVGIAGSERRHILVIIGVERQVELAPFPTQLTRGERVRLQGLLESRLYAPAVMVTTPLGEVIDLQTMRRSGYFGAWLDFNGPGRYTVEVMANGSQGPQIVALFPVYVDVIPPERPVQLTAAARSIRDETAPSPAQILFSLLNEERRSIGLPPLRLDQGLQRLALEHSRDMIRRHYFGHISPSGVDLTARLQSSGLAVERATENLVRSGSPSRAHIQLMESPAHRANLLDPDVSHVGIGAVEREGELIITQIFVGW